MDSNSTTTALFNSITVAELNGDPDEVTRITTTAIQAGADPEEVDRIMAAARLNWPTGSKSFGHCLRTMPRKRSA